MKKRRASKASGNKLYLFASFILMLLGITIVTALVRQGTFSFFSERI